MTRQQKAFRLLLAVAAAALLLVTAGGAYHFAGNPSFFVLRQSGVGNTSDDAPTDTQFLLDQHKKTPVPVVTKTQIVRVPVPGPVVTRIKIVRVPVPGPTVTHIHIQEVQVPSPVNTVCPNGCPSRPLP